MSRVSSPDFEVISGGEEFDTYGGTVSGKHHCAHVVVKVPHDILDNHGILAAPGFTDGTIGLDRFTNGCAENGVVAFSLDHPRTDDDDHSGDPEGHKASTLHLVTSRVIERFGLDREIDIAAHSEAGGNGTRFALKHPELVRTITLMGSGGLVEDDTPISVVLRTLGNSCHMVREFVPRLARHPCHNFQILGSSIGYVISNPGKAIGEALAISSHDIRHRLPLLHDVGIGTHALLFGKDEFFPPHLVDRSTEDGAIFNLYTYYPYDKNAGHLTPQFHPRLVGRVVLEGIDLLIASGFVGGKPKVSLNDSPTNLKLVS